MTKANAPKKSKAPQSTWTFSEGVLTVRHAGETVSLGRYASREWAAKAAAAYFARQRGARPTHTD